MGMRVVVSLGHALIIRLRRAMSTLFGRLGGESRG